MQKSILSIFLIMFVSSTLGYTKVNVSSQDVISSISQGVVATKSMLEGISINQSFEKGRTLLHYAVELQQFDVIEFLVEKGINLSIKGGESYGTALQEALYQGYLKIANFLIDKGTKLNVKNKDGNTALHIAAGNGYVDIVEKLLAKGASKYTKNSVGMRAYDLIPQLEYGADRELKSLLAYKKKRVVKYAQNSSTSSFKTNKNSEVSEQEAINAIGRGVSATKALLRKISVNRRFSRNKTLLHFAVGLRKYPVVVLLVQRGALLSEVGGTYYGTALQDALYFGYTEIASFLIQKGTRLNIKNSNGDTALHIAANNGYFGIVKELIAHGASKYSKNANGQRAYDLIPSLSWGDSTEIKKMLKYEEEKDINLDNNQNHSDSTAPKSMSKGFNALIEKNRGGNSNVRGKWNHDRAKIDKKSKVHDSDIGMSFDIGQ